MRALSLAPHIVVVRSELRLLYAILPPWPSVARKPDIYISLVTPVKAGVQTEVVLGPGLRRDDENDAFAEGLRQVTNRKDE